MDLKRFFFLLLLVFAQQAFAEGVINVVIGGDYAPYVDNRLIDGGVYTSLVKKLLNNMNYNYSVEFYPWARGYEMVAKGRAVLTFPYIKTQARENEVIYAQDFLMKSHLYLVTNLSEKNKNKNNLLDFKGSRFCSPVGYAKEDIIQTMIDKKELKEIREFDEANCLRSVMEDRADFLVLTAGYISEIKKDSEFKGSFRVLKPHIAIYPLYVIFSKTTDKSFIDNFNKRQHAFIQSQEYKKIILNSPHDILN